MSIHVGALVITMAFAIGFWTGWRVAMMALKNLIRRGDLRVRE